MKKTYLAIVITVTVLCVIIGSMIHVTGFLVRMGKGFNGMFGIGKKSEHITESVDNGSYTELEIDLQAGNVVITSGSKNCVEWNGEKDLKPEISESDGKLVIKQKDVNKLLDTNIFGNTLEVTVASPLKKLDVDVGMGNLDMGCVSADKADLNASMGNIGMKDSVFEGLDIDADAGNISFGNIEAQKIELDSNTGNITGSIKGSFKSLDADTDVGNIELVFDTALSDLTLDLKTDIGVVKINGEKTGSTRTGSGGTMVTARSELGNVNVDTK